MNKALFKMLLVQKGLTQIELAEALGMSKNILSNKVNGHSRVYTDEAIKICDVLKIDDNNQKAELFLNDFPTLGKTKTN